MIKKSANFVFEISMHHTASVWRKFPSKFVSCSVTFSAVFLSLYFLYVSATSGNINLRLKHMKHTETNNVINVVHVRKSSFESRHLKLNKSVDENGFWKRFPLSMLKHSGFTSPDEYCLAAPIIRSICNAAITGA